MLEHLKPYLKFGVALAAGSTLVVLYQGLQVYTYLEQVLSKAPRLSPDRNSAERQPD